MKRLRMAAITPQAARRPNTMPPIRRMISIVPAPSPSGESYEAPRMSGSPSGARHPALVGTRVHVFDQQPVAAADPQAAGKLLVGQAGQQVVRTAVDLHPHQALAA